MTSRAAPARCWPLSCAAEGSAGRSCRRQGCARRSRALLHGRGLTERVELVEGDIFTSVPATADVYLLKNVLHDWDDEACLRILKTVRSAMPRGSRLIVVEQLQERNTPDDFASLTDLQMLTQCDDGRERSAAELADLLRRPGCAPRGCGAARGSWRWWTRSPDRCCAARVSVRCGPRAAGSPVRRPAGPPVRRSRRHLDRTCVILGSWLLSPPARTSARCHEM